MLSPSLFTIPMTQLRHPHSGKSARAGRTLPILMRKITGGAETGERVGVSIHQDCGSSRIIPFLDCDTAGSE